MSRRVSGLSLMTFEADFVDLGDEKSWISRSVRVVAGQAHLRSVVEMGTQLLFGFVAIATDHGFGRLQQDVSCVFPVGDGVALEASLFDGRVNVGALAWSAWHSRQLLSGATRMGCSPA